MVIVSANRGYVQTSIAQSSKVAPQVAPADWAAKRQQQMENAKMLKLQREANNLRAGCVCALGKK
jgi:hypothetical protein